MSILSPEEVSLLKASGIVTHVTTWGGWEATVPLPEISRHAFITCYSPISKEKAIEIAREVGVRWVKNRWARTQPLR